MAEHWRDVPGYEGLYQVSDQGRVRSATRKGTKGGLKKQRLHKYLDRPTPVAYYVVNLEGHRQRGVYRVHRLVAMAFLGLQPHQQVDHINRDTLDNRLSNLRVCTNAQNRLNSKQRSNSKAPYKGISYDKRSGKWRARIQVNGKTTWLGRFDTPEDARDAYRDAAVKHHGEFARVE
ncbi:MAG TPA: NUMOD4 domain-containing protein [Terriglobales bacterium]|jgi:hypothetical protein|nr:NUMOD4 domain-containing protein [Terriglobales bacterium]